MVDQSIIKASKEGDQAAFKSLYESCISYVYTIVSRYVNNESDYPDVIQEVFARVFLSIDSYNSQKGEFKFWLRRICINQCIKHYNQEKSGWKMVALNVEQHEISDPAIDFSGLTEGEITMLLKDMPQGYRQVFLMVAMDGYTHKEVAEMLGISAVSSRSQLSRAKIWLQQKLSKNKLNLLAGGI